MMYVFFVESTAAPYSKEEILFLHDDKCSQYLDSRGNFYLAVWDKGQSFEDKIDAMMEWHFYIDRHGNLIEIIK